MPSLLGGPGKTQRGGRKAEMTTRDEKGRPHVYSLEVSLNSLWEWPWSSLRRGHHLVGFLDSPWGGVVWTEATLRGGSLKWSFVPNIQRLDAGSWDEAPNLIMSISTFLCILLILLSLAQWVSYFVLFHFSINWA